MRGAHVLVPNENAEVGIIPAYAGSTILCSITVWGHWDHPRVCGEHAKPESPKMTSSGSSPRMRGAHRGRGHLQAFRGIIPAYAGSTFRSCSRCAAFRDHPRVCGEHSASKDSAKNRSGSSPRMRGALRVEGFSQEQVGIIPAYAGSTRKEADAPVDGRDHPRVCGEHTKKSQFRIP